MNTEAPQTSFADALRHSLHYLHTYGHLPPKWRMQTFFYFDDDATPRSGHPNLILPDASKLLAEPGSPFHIDGYLQPRPYHAGEWSWARWEGAHENAVAESVNKYLKAFGKPTLHNDDWEWFTLAHKLREYVFAEQVPAYRPADGASMESAPACNRHEVKIATELLAVGHSLVVVEPVAQAPEHLTNLHTADSVAPRAPTVKLQCRESWR